MLCVEFARSFHAIVKLRAIYFHLRVAIRQLGAYMHSTISCHIEKPKNPITQIRLNQIHQKKTPGPINLSGETTNPYESTKYNKKTNNKKIKKQNCDLDLQSSPEQNHTSRPTENLQQNKKNKKILKQNSTKGTKRYACGIKNE